MKVKTDGLLGEVDQLRKYAVWNAVAVARALDHCHPTPSYSGTITRGCFDNMVLKKIRS